MSASKATDHFDLLPFIAILMCTLGTLLLVTLSMAAVNLGPGAGETWIPTPDASRPTKIPVLFQWDGNTLVVDRENVRTQIKIPLELYIQTPDGSQEEKAAKEQVDAGFAQLESDVLEDLERQRETHYALFAIRPSGFNSFGGFRNRFQKRNISIGTEPIEQGKPVKMIEKKAQK
jgi:hypothetical protein